MTSLSIADEVIVDAVSVGAVVCADGAGVDAAHEGQQRLARRQLPVLLRTVVAVALIAGHDGLDAAALGHVGVVLGPVTVVLRYLEKKYRII